MMATFEISLDPSIRINRAVVEERKNSFPFSIADKARDLDIRCRVVIHGIKEGIAGSLQSVNSEDSQD